MKANAGASATLIAYRAGGTLKRVTIRSGNGLHKPHIMTAGLAADVHIVGNDIGRLAGAVAVAAAEAADVGGPLLAILLDLAEPALFVDLRQGQ